MRPLQSRGSPDDMHRGARTLAVLAAGALLVACTTVSPSSHEMTTKTPRQLATPDIVDTRLGTLRFFDGVPSEATAQKVQDQLDFGRGIEVFLQDRPGAAMVAMRRGLREVGAVDGTIGIWDAGLDSRSLLRAGRSESVYASTWIDLRQGPVVIESPPGMPGALHDFWLRPVVDLGQAKPGSRLLVLPPGYQGEVPPGYAVARPATLGNWLVWSGLPAGGQSRAAARSLREKARVYPLAQAQQPHPPKFVDLSARDFNTLHADDAGIYRELDEIVQEEPEASAGPDRKARLEAIGIVKGRPFQPDGRMKRMLADAAAVGNAAARSMDFRPRDEGARIYPDGSWSTPFGGAGAPGLLLDAGTNHAVASLDARGRTFDGNHGYRLRVPPQVPAKDGWSVAVYDTQTRSLLQTDQRSPSLSSTARLKTEADGSVHIHFTPTPPPNAGNWVQTVPGKSWFVIFRLDGPLQPWLDRTWRLPDIEPL